MGDVLTVLGFGRQQHNQLSFSVWIHLYRCGGLEVVLDVEEVFLEGDGACFVFGKFG